MGLEILMLRAVVCALVLVALVPSAHAFELVSAEIVPGTFWLSVSDGLSTTFDVELFPTGPQDAPDLVDLNLVRENSGGVFGSFETVHGNATIELPNGWLFSSVPGQSSVIDSQIVFETFRVRFTGEPIAYLPVPPSSQALPGPFDVAFDVAGSWSLGDVVTPFSLTFYGFPNPNAQNPASGIYLHGALIGAPLPSAQVDGLTYTPEIYVNAALVLTPEPGSALLIGLGLVGLGASRSRHEVCSRRSVLGLGSRPFRRPCSAPSRVLDTGARECQTPRLPL